MVETKDLVQEGVRWLGACVVSAIILIGILAIVHDGDLAKIITNELVTAIQWGIPALAGLLGINQVAQGVVSSKQASASTPPAPPAPADPGPSLPSQAAVGPAPVVQTGPVGTVRALVPAGAGNSEATEETTLAGL